MKSELGIPHLKLYQDLYYLDNWDEELENKVCNMKRELNKWNWTVVGECKEVAIIIQLLYDWITDCVITIVPAEKLSAVFSKIHDEDLKANIATVDKSKKVSICGQIKNQLRNSEFESLVYIGRLLSEMLPSNEEEMLMFKRVCEKLLIILTGLNPRKIGYKYGDKNDELPAEINGLFKNFESLITFLSFIIKYDFDYNADALIQATHHVAGYSNKGNTTFNNVINQFKSDKALNQKTIISAFDDDKSFDLKNIQRPSISAAAEDSKDRDKNMYRIYQMLELYFKSVGGNVEDDPAIFEKDISSYNIEGIKEEQNQQSRLPKSKSLVHKPELSELQATGFVNNDMVVELFENFQNFLKIQNLPKISSNSTQRSKTSDMNNGNRLIISEKVRRNEMQVIEEDPNEAKYTRAFVSKCEDDKSEKNEERPKDDTEIRLKGSVLEPNERVKLEGVECPEENLVPVSSAKIILPKITKRSSSYTQRTSYFGYKFNFVYQKR